MVDSKSLAKRWLIVSCGMILLGGVWGVIALLFLIPENATAKMFILPAIGINFVVGVAMMIASVGVLRNKRGAGGLLQLMCWLLLVILAGFSVGDFMSTSVHEDCDLALTGYFISGAVYGVLAAGLIYTIVVLRKKRA